ncbi:MAG TPA: hypothetical protein VJT71_13865 [Pyrinomonadaceae bacterium]|nr:hypothetical protein [Pyrinomonadaceae bacterium]
MKKRLSITLPFLAIVSLLLTVAVVAATTIVVTPTNMDGWAEDSTPPADVQFVQGPGNPPLGSASAQFTVDSTGATDAELRNGNYDGLKLSNITQVDYWTYVTTNGGGSNTSCQAVYILLNVDQDANGSVDDFLFFEPCYQNGTYPTLPYSGTVPNQCGTNPSCVAFSTWQHWNAGVGGWWSANDSAGGPPLTTLAGYATQYPNAVIRNSTGATKGGLRLTAGFGGPADWGNFNGNVDAFSINGTTYDFEVRATATVASQCKNGGWQNLQRADGSTFKNQGDCIQYVNTGK